MWERGSTVFGRLSHTEPKQAKGSNRIKLDSSTVVILPFFIDFKDFAYIFIDFKDSAYIYIYRERERECVCVCVCVKPACVTFKVFVFTTGHKN